MARCDLEIREHRLGHQPLCDEGDEIERYEKSHMPYCANPTTAITGKPSVSGHGTIVQFTGNPPALIIWAQVACPGEAETRLNNPVIAPVPDPASFALILSTDQAK